MRMDKIKIRVCYGLAALSGILLSMSYSAHPLWWAAWLAPAPAILATMRAPAAHRRWLALVTGAVGGIGSFSYHLELTGWIATLTIFILVALAWSTAVRLVVVFAERRQFHLALVAIPVTWAAIDTLLIHVSPHGSAGSIAYSQMDALPVIQVASLGGIPAITFVVLLGGSLVGLLLARSPQWDARSVLITSILALLVVGATIAFGTMRLGHADLAPGTRVALIATDGVGQPPRNWDAFWQIYGQQITRVAKPGSIVVLPEAVVRLPMAAAEDAARTLAARASESRSTIIVGIMVDAPNQLTNRALIARPDGTSYWYEKQHLIPGIEAGITPGSRPLVLPFGSGGMGVAICKDMHFPTLARAYRHRRAQLMVVPAYDFEVDDWLAARMTVLRGVESGSSIARAARGGISFVSDRYGRVTAERRSDSEMGVLRARVPLDRGSKTVYASLGDAFGWTCVVAWAVLLALRLGWFRKRSGRHNP